MEATIQQETEKVLLENYEKYYRLAYAYTRREADALDVVQESAYKALRDCRKVGDASYISTWIYRIVVNSSLDLLRNRRKTEGNVGELGTEEIHEDTYGDPDLERAINSLDEKDRTVIILRYFEEQKLEDIAQIIGGNVSTVKSRLYRGLKKLRNAMEANQT